MTRNQKITCEHQDDWPVKGCLACVVWDDTDEEPPRLVYRDSNDSHVVVQWPDDSVAVLKLDDRGEWQFLDSGWDREYQAQYAHACGYHD